MPYAKHSGRVSPDRNVSRSVALRSTCPLVYQSELGPTGRLLCGKIKTRALAILEFREVSNKLNTTDNSSNGVKSDELRNWNDTLSRSRRR
jgi:hypothetical protein